MRNYLARLLHTERVHLTALFGVITALALLVLDLMLAGVVEAPTLPAAVIGPSAPGSQTIDTPPPSPVFYHYIEVVESCGPYYGGGACVNIRSGPGVEFPAVMQLRTGIVLEVSGATVDGNGRSWYKILPEQEIRYPERITSDWYVAADLVRYFDDDGAHNLTPNSEPTAKRIVVSRSKEMLYAYDGDTLFMETPISTGLELTPTPRGTYHVYRMTPSRYMQGPIPGLSDQPYDLPGVPWNLYFTVDGAVIHGAYWHDHFGQPWSHGCVNLPLQQAKELYNWADIGTSVIVQE